MIFTYMLKRIFVTIIFIIVIILINFTLFHSSPGDPTNQYFSPKINKAQLEKLRSEMGYDLAYHKQLGYWIKNISRGNLGYSWSEHRPVKDILAEAIPTTLQLTGGALLLNLVLETMQT